MLAKKFGNRLDVADDDHTAFSAYKRIFGLSASEQLVDSYSCALIDPQEQKIHGRLYISTSYVSFRQGASASGDYRTQVVIALADISEVINRKSSFGVTAPLELETTAGVVTAFTAFKPMARDAAHQKLETAAEAMRKAQTGQVAKSFKLKVMKDPETGGFGMAIDENAVVTGFACKGSAAETAGVPVGAWIVGVNSTRMDSQADVLAMLKSLELPEAEFEFSEMVDRGSITSSDAGTPDAASREAHPYTITFATLGDMRPGGCSVEFELRGSLGQSTGSRVVAARRKSDTRRGGQLEYKFESDRLGELAALRVGLGAPHSLTHNMLENARQVRGPALITWRVQSAAPALSFTSKSRPTVFWRAPSADPV
jgi:hypothetical protein